MNRLNLNQETIDTLRAGLETSYDDYGQPCPGSRLKLDDDVLWLGFAEGRILWGHDDPMYFFLYSPDIFGDTLIPVPVGTSPLAEYVSDRAPADPEEEPMPIYPESPAQQLAQQPGARDALKKKPKKPDAAEIKRVLHDVLAKLPKEAQHKARAYIKAHRADIQLDP